MAETAAQQVAVVDPDGNPGFVPAHQLDDALGQGYSLPDNPNETFGKQLETGAIGAAHGLIPGAPTAIQALGGPSIAEQKTLGETNPLAYGTGKLVGSGAQMLGVAAATGGLGELGEGAAILGEGAEGAADAAKVLPGAQAAADIAKGGDAAEAIQAAGTSPGAISDGADALAARGPQSLAEAKAGSSAGPSAYAAQAAAGGTSSGSDYVNEAELGDHDFNGESLAMHVGLGALLGAGSEGAINVLKDTIAPPVIEKAGQALESLSNKLGKTWLKVSDTVNGFEPGASEAAYKAIKGGAHKALDSEADELARGATQVREELNKAGAAHWGSETEEGFQSKETRAALADADPAGVRAAAKDLHTSLSNTIDEIEAKAQRSINVDKIGVDQEPLRYAQKGLREFEAVIKDPDASPYKIQRAIVKMRREVDDGVSWDKAQAPGPSKVLVDDLKSGIRAPIRDVLNNPEVWGSEAAGRNAAVNQKFTSFINAQKNAFKDLGQNELSEVGQKEFSISPAKLRNALNGDPLQAKLKLQHFGEYIDAAKEYLDELSTSAGNAGAKVPGGDDLEALLRSVTEQRKAAQAYAPVSALLKASRTQAPVGLGAGGAAPLAGFAAHALGAGAPVVAPLVAAVASVRAPVKAMQMFAKVSGAAAAAKDAIGAGVRKMLASPLARTEVTGTGVSALRGLTFQSRGGQASGQDFQKQAKHIGELAADQGRQLDTLQQNTSRLGSVAPLTTMSLQQTGSRALQVLNAALPRNPAPSPLPSENKDWEPNGSQLAAWNDLHQAVLKPAAFLGQLHDGSASPETWAALQQVYPKWATQVQQSTTDYITSHPKLDLDVGQKLAVSMVLGKAISPTVAPEQIAFQQAIYQPDPSQAAPGGAPHHGKSTQSGLAKLDIGSRTAPGHQRTK